MIKRTRKRTTPLGNHPIGDLSVITVATGKVTHMKMYEAYIVEPRIPEKQAARDYTDTDIRSSWKRHVARVARIVAKIKKVHPEVTVLHKGQFTTVISLPKSLEPTVIEMEFSCWLLGVRFVRVGEK